MNEPLKILVVDDDEIDRLALYRGLKKAGVSMEYSEASNYAEALARFSDSDRSSVLNSQYFDCVFLDYRLPDGDGLALIKDLQVKGVKVPLIVLTGQGDERVAVEMMKAGASDYLVKSKLSPEVLERTLRQAIRLHQAEKEAIFAQHQLRINNALLKQQNQELEQQRKQIEWQNHRLEELSLLKSQFLANMSHELRTPMNAIMGFSQLLLRQYPDPLTPQQLEIVQRVFNNSQNLLVMMNEILDFAKIEAGHFQLNFSKLDVGKLVFITVEEQRSLIENKKLSLQLNMDLKNPLIVTDRDCLRRILVNLISNAIKFTEAGVVEVKVRELNDKQIEIAIKDTGCGIPDDKLQEIFEAFRQIDQNVTRKYSGTGLGLAIADALVKMMQGKITVESKLGSGSIFRVFLPRQIDDSDRLKA
ncbi:MAG: ATP-binding protein [Xenococcaceae cyanobacterium]